MSALTSFRDTPQYSDPTNCRSYPVKASTKIYQGGLVALNGGYLVPGSTASGLLCVGRAEETVDNTSGSNGDKRCKVMFGTHRWVNGDSIAQADIGSVAYITDDQTVSKDGTGKSVAGIIEEVDSSGVWVLSHITVSGTLS